MKVVIVDHPKILGFLLRMYYHIPLDNGSKETSEIDLPV